MKAKIIMIGVNYLGRMLKLYKMDILANFIAIKSTAYIFLKYITFISLAFLSVQIIPSDFSTKTNQNTTELTINPFKH